MSRSCDLFLLLLESKRGGLGLLTENRGRQRRPTSLSAHVVYSISNMSRVTRVRASAEGIDPAVARTGVPKSRGQLLRDSLLSTVEFLRQRQASQVGHGLIADYLALDWLEWDGGTLRLTVTGRNVWDQLRAGGD